jgi:undecaprenyl-diphosphatase
MTAAWKALVLGIVEGLTEFLPVSSTGHLIVASAAVDYPDAGRTTIELFIQGGAILAVLWHYRHELAALAGRARSEGPARALVLKVLAAFVPAAVIGLLLHHAIEEHLFSPRTVAWSLVLGGVVLLVVESARLRPRVHDIERVGWRDALAIGLAQVASLVPGVSRAGATIVGGLLAGLDRPVATQFSFYLALPTVGAASAFALLKAAPHLTAADLPALAIGFVSAFVSALIVIRVFLAYVRTHDLRVFGYYRIAAGILLWILLSR